ncbi:TetR/AcrR family transcriptional regulator [Frankia sp. CNm7]|uniref:TetR/AcrR family transcriptional regulator n=1 Tax=Frankia nepalensis TaxID=1836974 RepID=A0A937RKB3_9ACTN|nr:TetR/AcrR family transcriptional regulator [Frankia nepalensis]MBL7501431.1 TetR/AcrR family transcriptional regulator [Frankia nepalensis]MBL7510006.1 TetR/AcrR family transcriptional regulator [Frankia nepalensis]MBL7517144.1 TetR/AcrR family transcriptional regulator [Frankia nepalensis]MBL7627983.1 TetR/AcrR family transcriptional regulator [Frankia nepalensis]
MTEPRRRRAATEEKVARVLDAAEEIMLREGHAAVTSRNVAERIGIGAPLLHYYFPTVDDLVVALLRRRSGRVVERMEAALASSRPLQAWWDLASDPRGTALFIEFLAAANHRPALKAEMGEVAREVRRTQMAVLDKILPEYDLDPEEFPPALIAATMQGLALGLVADEVAGYETAHKQARAAMSRLVARLEQRRAHRRPR